MEERKLPKSKIFWSKVKRRFLGKHLFLVRILLVLGVLIGIFLLSSFFFSLFRRSPLYNYFELVRVYLTTPLAEISSYQNRTNILLLGKSGEGHVAPDLTDTIILLSLSHSSNPSVALVSLPRDVWIPELRAKLNSAYYWGNQKQVGGGLTLAKASVEQIVGVPIHYGVTIDFSGFAKIIDLVGGIDVYVEREFEDKLFPIPGREDDICDGDLTYSCRYETIRFEKGMTHMNGELALKFVRSRHSEDLEEGTDTARSKRQQKVIEALVARIMNRDFIFSKDKIFSLFSLIDEYVETDMTDAAIVIAARRFIDASGISGSYVIPEELLLNPAISPTYDNQYVFIPSNKSGDWQEVWDFVAGVLP